MKILSTKSLDSETIRMASDRGFVLSCADFIKIKPIPRPKEFLNNYFFDAVVFTSFNAVRNFITDHLTQQICIDKYILSLSGKTADALRGFDIFPDFIADNSEEIGNHILSCKELSSVLHPCSNLRLDNLNMKLKNSVISYYPMVVYETVNLYPTHITDQFDVIMFFSPSGIECFLQANELSTKTLYCCIGSTTAHTLEKMNDSLQIITAQKPNPVHMIYAIEDYYKMVAK